MRTLNALVGLTFAFLLSMVISCSIIAGRPVDFVTRVWIFIDIILTKLEKIKMMLLLKVIVSKYYILYSLVRPIKLQHIFESILVQDLNSELCNRIPSSELSVFCNDYDLWYNCAYKCQKRFPDLRPYTGRLFIF